MKSSVEDVLMQELLKLQVAELRLTGMYNSLRTTPADRRDTGEFLAHLAELDHRASEVERLLEQMPTAIPLSRRLVA